MFYLCFLQLVLAKTFAHHIMKVEVLSNFIGLKPLKRRRTPSDCKDEESTSRENVMPLHIFPHAINLKRLRNASVMTVTSTEIGTFFRLFGKLMLINLNEWYNK